MSRVTVLFSLETTQGGFGEWGDTWTPSTSTTTAIHVLPM